MIDLLVIKMPTNYENAPHSFPKSKGTSANQVLDSWGGKKETKTPHLLS